MVLAAAGGLLYVGACNDWILCWTNCGEVFDALQYVSNYRLYGLEYGLVQDMATAPTRTAHPFFYTHNPNIAGYVFVVLDLLGSTSLAAKQVFTLVVFCGGLLYAYGAVRLYTGSAAAGLTMLLLMLVDVEHVLAFGLNPLRAWHWVALFGLLFHVRRIAGAPSGRSAFDWTLVALLAFVSLGIGYDFWIICCAVSLIAMTGSVRASGGGIMRRAGWMAALFALPVLLRQLQVMAVLGFDFWSTDVLLSAAIKSPVVTAFVNLPSLDAIDAMYRNWNVLRPPAQAPARTFASVLALWIMVRETVVPSYGLVTVVNCLCMTAGCAWYAASSRLSRPGPAAREAGTLLSGIREGPPGPLHSGWAIADWSGTRLMILALGGGVLFGMLSFAPLSFHIYIKHGFPLLAAPLLVAKSVSIVVLGAAAFIWGRRVVGSWVRKGAAALFALMLLDTAVIATANARALNPIDTSWVGPVARMQGHTFAVSWIPNSVSDFTRQWAVGIAPGRERVVADRLRAGDAPFRREDLFLFGERDADVRIEAYLHPEFWLYFPTAQNTQLDHPSPTCRRDWLTSGVRAMTPALRHPVVLRLWAVSRRVARPGDRITVSGVLDGDRMGVSEVLLVGQDGSIGRLQHNCIYRTVSGSFTVPANAPPGTLRYSLALVGDDARRRGLLDFEIGVDPGAAQEEAPTFDPPAPQPSPAELATALPALPIVARGTDFVMFDLRPAWAAMSAPRPTKE